MAAFTVACSISQGTVCGLRTSSSERVAINSKLKVTSISNKRMSAIDIEEKEVIETIYDLKTDSYVESTIINEIRSSMEFFKQ